jgi:Phosphodiester glycosidase
MRATQSPRRRLRVLPRRHSRLEHLGVGLPDGARTTLHVASFERSTFAARVVAFDEPAPLVRWCAEEGIRHALVGGFFVRPGCRPLGELRIDGATQPCVPFDPPWGAVRACVHAFDGEVSVCARHQLGTDPPGDVLQAGPLLVAEGRRAFVDGEDREGFSAASHQFDSDITAGRYPRAALAVTEERLLAVACDGRTERDAGMTLGELADALLELGAIDALNLDGGGSASLVHDGRLRNRPREQHGVDLLEGRPVVTALVFEPR